jgi:hypothetical protein
MELAVAEVAAPRKWRRHGMDRWVGPGDDGKGSVLGRKKSVGGRDKAGHDDREVDGARFHEERPQ